MIKIGNKYEVINSYAGNNGLIVTVTGYGGNGMLHGISDRLGDHWYIDRLVETNKSNLINHLCEKQLKPIYDGNEKIEWADMKGIFIPNAKQLV